MRTDANPRGEDVDVNGTAEEVDSIARLEQHRSERVGWLRAAVLGADDGIVSTASLTIGVAAAAASRSTILVAGLAGLVAGAMSMAAGSHRPDRPPGRGRQPVGHRGNQVSC